MLTTGRAPLAMARQPRADQVEVDEENGRRASFCPFARAASGNRLGVWRTPDWATGCRDSEVPRQIGRLALGGVMSAANWAHAKCRYRVI